ncbi:type 1 glutamine amidotransferase [Dongshaea marina]|uniref:type 1 glutamine amidotransferase n=1 Tax=Dongshaea marina TaxID=2047966 RepID=UPI00190093E8|nr:type 1 glutamine amidotransferase [Dongshaea marina]
MKKKEFKGLLLQIRDQRKVRLEEWESFACLSGLALEQLDILNVFDTPHFDADVLQGYDALFVGGASEANVLQPDKYPFVGSAQRLLVECLDSELPVFASCFGYQLAVLALGGEIIHQQQDFEMGSVPISLTREARQDPLFSRVDDPFMAISVHQQKSLQCPPGCVSLAYTQQCHHAFRVKDKPFWAFQFHPEVDRATLVERLTFYKDKYTTNDAHLDEVLKSTVETPESNALPRIFTDWVVSQKS